MKFKTKKNILSKRTGYIQITYIIRKTKKNIT